MTLNTFLYRESIHKDDIAFTEIIKKSAYKICSNDHLVEGLCLNALFTVEKKLLLFALWAH